MSDIKEKVEMELKPYEAMCETLTSELKEIITGNANATPQDTLARAKTLGEIVDVKKDIVEMCYKKQIMEAMEEHADEYGETWDEDGMIAQKFYRGQPRNRMGQYTSRGGSRRRGYNSMMPMDMDEMNLYPENNPYGRDMDAEMGRMYYNGDSSGSGSSGSRQGGSGRSGSRGGGRSNSRYGFAHDEYMEKRQQYSKSAPEENSKRIELLNDFAEDLEDMAKEVVRGMSPEEKQVWKMKLNKLSSM